MKETAFTRRLVVFHETLAPVKGSSERLPVIAGLWHEAVADRKAVEVTGAILKLLSAPQLPSDTCSELVVWLDNCGGQNKSYVLFQTLHNAVRSGVIKFDSLTLKYFVPGHSFMAADSFHAAVERKLKRTRTILNFQEFVVSIINYYFIILLPC